MATSSFSDAANRMLDPMSTCFTAETARQIADWRADPVAQERLDLLAEKHKEGTITPDELTEYDSIVQAGSFIAVLQSKARRFLREMK